MGEDAEVLCPHCRRSPTREPESRAGVGAEVVPSHWRQHSVSATDRATYEAIHVKLACCASTSFVAGSMCGERIIRVLRRRAPHMTHQLPLPVPLTLQSIVSSANPSSLEMLLKPDVEYIDRAVFPDDGDLRKALACGALVDADGPISHWSPMFSVKQGEKTRLIFDLRALNVSLEYFPFRLEHLPDLPALARGCSYVSKVDLQSAYWQYPVDEALSRALGTSAPSMPGRLLRWVCLPFGLSVAPFAFASITHAFVRAWRAAGVIVTAYLDDILILAESAADHVRAVGIVVGDLLQAGLRISPAKAFILPYKSLDYLGMTVDVETRSFVVPAAYREKLRRDAELIRGCHSGIVAARTIQRFLGRIAFASIAIPWLAYFRAALTHLLASDPVPETVSLDREAMEEVTWWLGSDAASILRRPWTWDALAQTRLYCAKGDMPRPHFSVHGDASDRGIGLRLSSGDLVSEPLPPDLPPSSPSVARELYAMCRLVERDTFPPGSVVRILSDATGAVHTALGATVTTSTAAWARRLFMAALEKEVVLQIEWVPRALLSDVDAASRWDAADAQHARLPLRIVRRLIHHWFGPGGIDVEFFSSVHNRVGGRICLTREPHPFSAGDGLSLAHWRAARRGWAFPPFGLLRPVLKIATCVGAQVILVLPDSSWVGAVLRHWRRIPLPPPLAPPDFVRHLHHCPPLAAFLPPHPRQARSAV